MINAFLQNKDWGPPGTVGENSIDSGPTEGQGWAPSCGYWSGGLNRRLTGSVVQFSFVSGGPPRGSYQFLH